MSIISRVVMSSHYNPYVESESYLAAAPSGGEDRNSKKTSSRWCNKIGPGASHGSEGTMILDEFSLIDHDGRHISFILNQGAEVQPGLTMPVIHVGVAREDESVPEFYPMSRMDVVMLIDWLMAAYPRLRLVALSSNPYGGVIMYEGGK